MGLTSWLGWRNAAAVRVATHVNRAMVDLGMGEVHRVGRSDLLQVILWHLPTHTETEWSVPAEFAAEALQDLLTWTERDGTAMNMAYEIRCSARDDGSWMSQAYGRDVCHTTICLAHAPDAHLQHAFTAFEGIMLRYGGRPHFGKRIDASPAVLSRLFPKWPHFLAARQALDPGGIFDNEFLQSVLGPHPARPLPAATAAPAASEVSPPTKC
jgi:L-gulonolactone oxidase